MLNIRLIILIGLLNSISYCQQPAIIGAGSSGESLSFAVVSCSDTMLFPSLRGELTLPSNDTCVCSHLGFHDKLIITTSIEDTIWLFENSVILPNVEIIESAEPQAFFSMGPISESKVKLKQKNLFGININRGAILTYIPGREKQSTIHSVTLNLNSIKPNVLFRLRLVSLDSLNQFESDILTHRIEFDRETYKSKVDLSKWKIPIPRKGIYVCVEWSSQIDKERAELWSRDGEPFFNVVIDHRKKLAKYKSYLTSNIYFGIGQRLNPMDNSTYFIGTPMVGIEVVDEKS